jgi:hypothetical protein
MKYLLLFSLPLITSAQAKDSLLSYAPHTWERFAGFHVGYSSIQYNTSRIKDVEIGGGLAWMKDIRCLSQSASFVMDASKQVQAKGFRITTAYHWALLSTELNYTHWFHNTTQTPILTPSAGIGLFALLRFMVGYNVVLKPSSAYKNSMSYSLKLALPLWSTWNR